LKEFFITANSFAAPFFSDSSEQYIKASSPQEALETFAAEYTHPFGLYAAVCYKSADSYHKNEKPLAKWLCNHELAKIEATKDKGCYSYLGNGPGNFEIDGKKITVPDPQKGRVL
jgi:hypothetical protein